MARHHGRRGAFYAAIATPAATLTRVASLTEWSFESSTDKEEVTAMGDTNKQYVAGIPDATGDMSGVWDDAGTWSLYAASSDGLARPFIIYPTTNVTAAKISGDAYFDYSVEGSVDGRIEFSSEWTAAGTITVVGV